jgi:hypothetical protein
MVSLSVQMQAEPQSQSQIAPSSNHPRGSIRKKSSPQTVALAETSVDEVPANKAPRSAERLAPRTEPSSQWGIISKRNGVGVICRVAVFWCVSRRLSRQCADTRVCGVSDVRMSWSQKPISHAPVQMHEIGFVEATRVTDLRRYAATRSRV